MIRYESYFQEKYIDPLEEYGDYAPVNQFNIMEIGDFAQNQSELNE